jgi:predicted nucleic acid-binding protein
MRIFWDTNVIIDLVDRDRPDHMQANALLRWSATKPVAHLCAWHTLSILDYLACKKFGRKDTIEILRELLGVFTVPPTGTREASEAFTYLQGDYEDAMQIAAAVAGGSDCIVTRDKAGFSKSPVPVVLLDQFLTRYGNRLESPK